MQRRKVYEHVQAQDKQRFGALEGGKLMSGPVMTLLCYLILVTVVILPVFMIIYYAFWDGTKIDFQMFFNVLMQKENLTAMRNTLVIAVFSTLLATAVGVFFAGLLAAATFRLKGVMKFLFSIPFMIPPFLAAHGLGYDVLRPRRLCEPLADVRVQPEQSAL